MSGNRGGSKDVDESLYFGVNEIDDIGARGVTNGRRRHSTDRDERDGDAPEITSRIESAAVVAVQPAEPILYDIDIMLPSDDAPALVFGPPAAMKSWIALHVCDVIVRGAKFLGRFDVRKRPRALYVNIDAGPKSFRNRMRRTSDAQGLDFLSISSAEFSLVLLRKLLMAYDGGFVVLDCWAAIYHPDRAREPGDAMREFIDTLRNLYTEFDCGGLVIDHPHRPKEVGALGDYAGNIQKEATFRTAWHIVADPAVDGQPRRTKIMCRKASEGAEFPALHAIIDFNGDRVDFSTMAGADPAARENVVEAKLRDWALRQTKTFSKSSAVEGARAGRAVDVRPSFDDMVARGEFIECGKRGGGSTYRLAESVPESVPDQSVPIQDRDGTDWPDLGRPPTPSSPSESVPKPDGVCPRGTEFAASRVPAIAEEDV